MGSTRKRCAASSKRVPDAGIQIVVRTASAGTMPFLSIHNPDPWTGWLRLSGRGRPILESQGWLFGVGLGGTTVLAFKQDGGLPLVVQKVRPICPDGAW